MSKPSAQPSKIKTQDEPFDLDALETEAKSKDYQFRLGGQVWVMPAISRLDRKQTKRLAKAMEAGEIAQEDYFDYMFRLALGDERFEEFDALPLSQGGMEALFEDWTNHSGIEIPESPASTDS